ncbi:hypothetical protein OIU74_011727 [Salix koriyanagi]|uniref:Uncharacterized protein n=1 Tax=Salix koriyanagi TaxID=2511006 RepID=A0A9Q0TFY1_9ROSI|nr:hypothetical protein OIU74_011727 [Salix koriyanagi]
MPSWIFLQNLTSSFRFLLTGVSPLFLLQVLALAISETRGGKPAQLVKRAFIESTGPCWMVFRALFDMGPCTDPARITSAVAGCRLNVDLIMSSHFLQLFAVHIYFYAASC